MRWALTILAWPASLAVLAPVCCLGVTLLAGPHSSLLPSFVRPPVILLGWGILLVVPLWIARAVGRRSARRSLEGLIEREIPGAGKLSAQGIQDISKKSCGALGAVGTQIQWVQSYVTDNKIYCIYIAPSDDEVRKHASQGVPSRRIACPVSGPLDGQGSSSERGGPMRRL